MSEKGQVLDMVRAGTITRAEADRLIDAIGRNRPAWQVLVDPFDRLSTAKACALAAAAIVACLAVSRLGFRFDGALDIHLVRATPPWRVVFIDQLIAVGVTTLAVWLASLVSARRGRVGDFLVAVSIARWPLAAIGVWMFLVLPPAREVLAQATAGQPSPRLLVISLMALPLFAWFIILLYRGFTHASGLKGGKAGITFGVAVILAELASKLALMAIYSQR